MTVLEVEVLVDKVVEQLPAAALAALAEVTIHVARDRQDLEVLHAAVLEAGKGAVSIPGDFRGMFLGDPIDPDDEESQASGVIVLNAAKLLTAEDVSLTLLHEVGHALGFDEYEVALLGLE
jgi:predicted Zn-dependent protease with MMP-like domain